MFMQFYDLMYLWCIMCVWTRERKSEGENEWVRKNADKNLEEVLRFQPVYIEGHNF